MNAAAAARLEALYLTYNRARHVHPDPLEFLYRYEDPQEREMVGLVASCLAYGRVAQILRSIEEVLRRLPGAPAECAGSAPRRDLRAALAGFRHRFTTGEELADLLAGAGAVVGRYGSLERGFAEGCDPLEETVVPSLGRFTERIASAAGRPFTHLLPHPRRRSACKRPLLFLRWMVRRDDVDPGGWSCIPASKLVVPLDTHMHRICGLLGLTRRAGAGLATALEVTQGFRRLAPSDPVKYDFTLTRLGMRAGAELAALVSECGGTEAA
jgi:uncharacterized protein (TIGR02757 family)